VILHSTTRDVAYLPLPNRVEIVFTRREPDPKLTRTAFLIPLFDDRSVMLAQNTRRGLEIPGGHVDKGETLVEAAIREALEETGCVVRDIVCVGHQRMTVEGDCPEGYQYPYPVSFQQFYAGRVERVTDYVENDECLAPVRLMDLSEQRKSVQSFVWRARHLLWRA
jgi:8-oxo-dGTP diphosphatase